MFSFFENLNYELIVAGLALVLTLWEARESRRHNRLSVRPLLAFSTGRVRTDGGCNYSFSITNQGIGPALIADRYFVQAGKRVADDETIDYPRSAFSLQLTGKHDFKFVSSRLPGKKSAILPGETILLCEVFVKTPPNSDTIPGPEIFSGLELEIRYESFYGEKFEFSTS
jgi:hypothetical protein